MRFFKIVLIIFSTITLGGTLYMLYEEFLESRFTQLPLYTLVCASLMILFSFVNIVYHIKTFRFYRRKEKRNLDKKVSKILWAGTICFSVVLLFIIGNGMYRKTQRYLYVGLTLEDLFFILIFVVPALLGFLEVSVLKKRIKRLRAERDTKEGIEEIGNQTI